MTRRSQIGFPAIAVTIVAICCSGCVSFPVFDARLSRREIRNDRATRLPYKVAVRDPYTGKQDSDRALSVSNVVADLRATGLFADVGAWSTNAHPDLIVDVADMFGVTRCGTPFLASFMTLGLLSAESDYRECYKLTLVAPSTGRNMPFNREYAGIMYMPSFLLLPFTFWERWPDSVDLLRHDLAAQAHGIESLVKQAKDPSQPSRRSAASGKAVERWP